MYFLKIFSLKVVASSVDQFTDFLLASKLDQAKIVTALSMNEFLQIPQQTLKKIDFLIPDGMPMVWLMKLLDPIAERIYGPDVMEMVLQKTAQTNHKHFFYGSTNEVLAKLVKKIKQKYPAINVVGVMSPPFRELTIDEENEYFAQLEQNQPDFIWLSLGGKKQAEASLRLRSFINHPAYIMPVGAAFDFISGHKQQAPQWLRQLGLEWFFRLITEPRRLWRRYLLQIPIFLVLWFWELLRIIYSKVTKNN